MKTSKLRVVINPGHGPRGGDPGAGREGVWEADIVRAIALEMKKLPTPKGVRIEYKRQPKQGKDGLSALGILCQTLRRNKPDVLISLHLNSTREKETRASYCLIIRPAPERVPHKVWVNSGLLANLVSVELSAAGLFKGCQRWDRGLAILRRTAKSAAVLVELGFINNPSQRAKMLTSTWRKQVARAILKAVGEYAKEEST